ncbi:MAG: EAL domain-containing protein [Hyphomicrobiales bacterium]
MNKNDKIIFAAFMRKVALLALPLIFLVVAAGSSFARDIVSTSFTSPSVDLVDVIEPVQTDQANVQIEMPPDASGTVSRMTLAARGDGPVYRWGVFSMRNQDPQPRDLVLASRHWGFIGSGLIWPDFRIREIVNVQSSPGLQPSRLLAVNADAYHIRISPGETVTFAIEWAGAVPNDLTLWQRPAYDAHVQKTATFYGVLIGFALLMLIGAICLFVIRPQLVFLAGILFTLASIGFLAGEFGYLENVSSQFLGGPVTPVHVRAISEALVCAGLIACLIMFTELHRRMPIMWNLALIALALALCLAVWAWVDPLRAAAIARVSFAFSALISLLIAMAVAFGGSIRAKVSLSYFVAVFVWTLVAAAGAFVLYDAALMKLLVSCGLVLVLATTAMTLARFAFSQGVVHSRFFEESGRRALALAGSEQSVWDWNEDKGRLYVGPELERALGYPAGRLTKTGLKGWMAIIHPADRSNYIAGVETAIARGRGRFSEQFRLRKFDGTYRWYELRARALPGEHEHASRCIGTLADITSDKRAEDSLLFDAVHDRITRLPNRALFLDRLERSMRRAVGNEADRLFILVADLDRFKNVNDGLGHTLGDSLLLAIARRLRQFAGPDDTLARLSGDQFGLILNPAEPPRDVTAIANQIAATIAHPIEIQGREVVLTACLGIAEYRRDTEDAGDVLKDAEIALYEAKRRGKNNITEFNPNMRDTRSKLVKLESELRRALDRNEIEVMFQPITRVEDQELAGFEALMRWRHRERGLLKPDEFLETAEETGLISEIGEYVLNESARQLGIWQRAFRPKHPLFVSVNLSHNQLLGRGLVDDVKNILGREDLAAGTLRIEITESKVMENPELAIQVLDRLRRLDIGLSCDDFGTGYSSLAVLQRLPFDTLKLDKSFLEADRDDDAAATILEAVIALAHDLDMAVVAEGVEDEQQLERLRELDCDFAQGYHFGESMTAREVIETLGGSPFRLTRQGRSGSGFLKRMFDRERPPAPGPAPTRPSVDDESQIPPAPQPAQVPIPPAPQAATQPAMENTAPVAQAPVASEVPPPAPVQSAHAPRQGAVEQPSQITVEAPVGVQLPPPMQPAAQPLHVDPGAAQVQLERQPTPPPLPQPAPPPVQLPPPLVPEVAAAPEGDDLLRIEGISEDINRVLADMGISSFAQIAGLSGDDAESINARIGFPGRIQRELWVEQASDLAEGGPAWDRGRVQAVQLERARASQTAIVRVRVREEALMPQAQSPAETPQDVQAPQPPQAADDLGKIKGIGPAIKRDLNDMGLTAFAQLAELPDEQARALNERIGFPGRVEREQWREQARTLLLNAQSSADQADTEAESREGVADDISRIGGIGDVIKMKLAAMGYSNLKDVAAMSDEDAARISENIGFPGRVEREEWREQARELLAGKPPRAKVDREADKLEEAAPDVSQATEPAAGAVAESSGADEPVSAEPVTDDLKKIKGIGKKLASVLEDEGITSFAALAGLDDEAAKALGKKVGFPGRVEREKWREQAQEFAKNKGLGVAGFA